MAEKKNWNIIDFCPEKDIPREEIIRSLNRNLFNSDPSLSGFLEKRYKFMSDNFTCREYSGSEYSEILPTDFISVPPLIDRLLKHENLGHDLPIWLCRKDIKDQAKRVMFVGQDPLRHGIESGKITLSTPWGLHSERYRGNRIMTQIIWRLLVNENVLVYLTDLRKFYAAGVDISKIDGVNITFENTLDEEINIIHPDIIVSVGACASTTLTRDIDRNNIEKTDKFNNISEHNGILVLQRYHPNARVRQSQLGGKRKVDYYCDAITELLKS